jgi:hypothetical protein
MGLPGGAKCLSRRGALAGVAAVVVVLPAQVSPRLAQRLQFASATWRADIAVL